MAAEVLHLETERDKAERYKAQIREALGPVVELMDEMRRDGFLAHWELGVDPYGRSRIVDVAVIKRY
jgi:hypothetical protein